MQSEIDGSPETCGRDAQLSEWILNLENLKLDHIANTGKMFCGSDYKIFQEAINTIKRVL